MYPGVHLHPYLVSKSRINHPRLFACGRFSMLPLNHAVPPHVVQLRQDKQQDIKDTQSHETLIGFVV